MCEYLFTTHPRPDGLWSGGLQRCNPAVAVQLGGMVEVATSCNITTIRYITAQLRVPHLISMGQGLFKMAHQAYITVASLSREPVVVKQVYFTHAKLRKPTETAVTRYDPVNEFTKTVTEANLLFWGISLFQFTSSFVDNHILKAAQAERRSPPFSIPRLPFVFGGVAVVHEVSQGATVGATMTICRAYLVKDFMPGGNSEFMNKAVGPASGMARYRL